MKLKHLLSGLAALALIGSISEGARAQLVQFDSVIEKIQLRQTMKVGVAPFGGSVMCSTGGGLVGFDIDIATKIAGEMGVELELIMTGFKDLIPDLLDEEFDVIISSLGMTTQRSLRVNFTSPADIFGLIIVANTAKTQGVSRLEDLNRASVTFAVVAGTTGEDFLNTDLPDATPLILAAEADILPVLLNGTAHAAGLYEPTPTLWLEEHPDILRRLPGLDRQYNAIPGGFAVRKSDPDAVNFFNSWIAANRANGWLQQRAEYWFRTSQWVDQVADSCDG